MSYGTTYRITVTYLANYNDLPAVGSNDTEEEAIRHIKDDITEELEFCGHTCESIEIITNPL